MGGGIRIMEEKTLTYGQIARRNMWSERIIACKNSNMTVAEWCAQNDVREKTYWKWHKKLKDEYLELGHEDPHPDIYEIDVPVVADAAPNNIVASIKSGKISIEIYSENATTIATIIKTVKSC